MVLEMQIPSPGESISEVEIAEWLVADGEYVEKDQIIAEIDSDKATLELPAEQSGVITLKADEAMLFKLGKWFVISILLLKDLQNNPLLLSP